MNMNTNLIPALIPCAVIGLWFFGRAMAWAGGVWAREKPLSSRLPFPMRGKPDIVLWERDLSLTVADLKTRKTAKAMRSDVIQLSCYASMLRRKAWWKVNDHGYILVPEGDGVAKIKVRLLDDAALLKIRDRWDDILAGRVEPTKCDGRLCRTCAFREKECTGAD